MVMGKNGLVFFYGKLGGKITAEKETQQFVQVAAQLRNPLKENLDKNWTFKKDSVGYLENSS